MTSFLAFIVKDISSPYCKIPCWDLQSRKICLESRFLPPHTISLGWGLQLLEWRYKFQGVILCALTSCEKWQVALPLKLIAEFTSHNGTWPCLQTACAYHVCVTSEKIHVPLCHKLSQNEGRGQDNLVKLLLIIIEPHLKGRCSPQYTPHGEELRLSMSIASTNRGGHNFSSTSNVVPYFWPAFIWERGGGKLERRTVV